MRGRRPAPPLLLAASCHSPPAKSRAGSGRAPFLAVRSRSRLWQGSCGAGLLGGRGLRRPWAASRASSCQAGPSHSTSRPWPQWPAAACGPSEVRGPSVLHCPALGQAELTYRTVSSGSKTVAWNAEQDGRNALAPLDALAPGCTCTLAASGFPVPVALVRDIPCRRSDWELGSRVRTWPGARRR